MIGIVNKARQVTLPCDDLYDVINYALLNFFLKPASQNNPELKRSMVVGSGTGFADGTGEGQGLSLFDGKISYQ